MTHNRDCAARRHRRGWTLIELLIVCSITGVLSVTGVVTIGLLLSAEGRGADALVHQTTVSRLSARFRDDVHAANTATIEDSNGAEQDRLVLQRIDGGTTTYQVADGALERRVDGGARDGSRERYRLPENSIRFESNEDGIVRLVIVVPRQVLSDSAAGELPPPASLRIAVEAAVAWDRRNSRSAQTTGSAGE